MSSVSKILTYDTQMNRDKRRSLAAFYTPIKTAEKMAFDAVDTFLKIHGIDCELLKNQPIDIINILQKAKFLDMSCGTGVFAYAYLKCIQQLGEKLGIDLDLSIFTQHMILNDLDPCAIQKVKLMLKTAFDIDFLGELITVDALLDLDQEPCIKAVLSQGGFDIIMSNPPYFGEKGHTEIFKKLKVHSKHQVNYQGKMDYFYFFIHQGIDYLKNDGVMSCITTNYFTTADSAQKLRHALKTKTKLAVLRPDACRFQDAKSIRVLAYTVSKTACPCKVKVIDGRQTYTLKQEQLFDERDNLVIFPSFDHTIINKIKNVSSLKLSDVLSVKQGLVSGADKVTSKIKQRIPDAELGAPIFVFDKVKNTEDEHLKPLVKNSDIGAYALKRSPSKTVLYSSGEILSSNQRWLDHLHPYRPALEQRREVKNGRIPWYALQWSREQAIFEQPKIIAPQRAPKNVFSYMEEACYGSADIYFLTYLPNASSKYIGAYHKLTKIEVLKALTMYLNSPLVYYWLYLVGKKKAKMLELYATPLRHIPIVDFKTEDLKYLVKQYDLWIQTLDKLYIFSANQRIFNCANMKKMEIERIFSIFNKNKNDE